MATVASAHESVVLGTVFLDQMMDEFHQTVNVSRDVSSPGDHFYGRQLMPDASAPVTMVGDWIVDPHTGATAIRSEFVASQPWGGIYFQNGLLPDGAVSPVLNFGSTPNAGIDLTGATELTFWAKGEKGGEKIEFFMGGIGRNASTGAPIAPFPDSTPRVPSAGSDALVVLTTEWKQYRIDLRGRDLSYVLGGFAWTATSEANPNGAVFYLDDIQYELGDVAREARLNEPRFVRSYATLPIQSDPSDSNANDDFDTVLRNTAFTYDNALAVLQYLATSTPDGLRRAKLIGDQFVYASEHDRYFTDGRLRSLYAAGDQSLPPGWTPNNRVGTVPVAGYYTDSTQTFHELQDTRGGEPVPFAIDTGNNAWALISLLALFRHTGDARYLNTGLRIAEFLHTQRNDAANATYRGFLGGIEAPESVNPVQRTWASVEHNLDIYAAMTTLFELTGDIKWRDDAAFAKVFVEAMWEPQSNCFLAGTVDSSTRNTTPKQLPLDVQAWSVLAIPETITVHPQVLSCAETYHRVTEAGKTGYDFNEDKDGIWLEGVGQVSVAYAGVDPSKAEVLRQTLRDVQGAEFDELGGGIPAALHDGLSTGFEFQYFHRAHIAAAAWNTFGQLGANPYYLTPAIVVNSTADPGDGVCDANECTLREAMTKAEEQTGRDRIYFSLPGPGPYSIKPLSTLPTMFQPVVIDASTQLGYVDHPVIELNGSLAGTGNGLNIRGGQSVIRGLAVNSFLSGDGVVLEQLSGSVIEGTFLGTDVTGTVAKRNNVGLRILNSQNNSIGGPTPSSRNILSGNSYHGVNIQGWGSTNNRVLGNYVGVDASGLKALGNGANGVDIWDNTTNNVIGGTLAAERNIISANGTGVVITYGARGNVVQGNFIGTAANGATLLGNRVAVRISEQNRDTSKNLIGGTADGAGNIIAGNGSAIVIFGDGTQNNSVLGNSIHDNGGLGIDIGVTGVNLNDANDADAGPNGLQNYPTVNSATTGPAGVAVAGNLVSVANSTYRLEFFTNEACDSSGYGEGRTFLGSLNVTTNESGSASFSATLPGRASGGQVVTATATSDTGATSEFSPCRTVVVPPSVPPGAPVLAAPYDTGISSTDGITYLDNSIRARALQFAVPGTIAGAQVAVYADGWLVGTAVATASTTSVLTSGGFDLVDGSHTFTARQTEPDKALSADSTSLTLTIDTLAPPTPVALDLLASSDSGVSSLDNITSVNTPTFAVVAAPYFRLTRDDLDLGRESYWSGTTTTLAAQPDGTHVYRVRAVDAAGNLSPQSAGLAVTIDTATPAMPGLLDSTLGGVGKAVSGLSGSGYDAARTAGAWQSDGKLIVAGYVGGGAADFGVARYNSDGSLDTQFGLGGRLLIDIADGYDVANHVALQADGKILLAGMATVGEIPGVSTASGSRMAVVRLNPNGTLDPTFDGDGKLVIPRVKPYLGAEAIRIVALADGRILVGGTAQANNDRDLVVLRLSAAGVVDDQFGVNGLAAVDFGADDDFLTGLAVQADGKVLLAGSSSANGPTQDSVLARFDSRGNLDASFDVDGKQRLHLADRSLFGGGLAVQPDGKIVVATGATGTTSDSSGLIVSRYTGNGALDTSFGGTGWLRPALVASVRPSNVAVRSDGRIVVTGLTQNNDVAVVQLTNGGGPDSTWSGDGLASLTLEGILTGDVSGVLQGDGKVTVATSASRWLDPSGANFAVARFTPTGDVDSLFDTDGAAYTDFLAPADEIARAAISQPDGKTLIAGSSNGRSALVRLNGNGSLDATFGRDGRAATGSGREYVDVALDASGLVVALASPNTSTPNVQGLVRYLSDGTLDTTFGSGGRVSTTFAATDVSPVALALAADGKILAAATVHDNGRSQIALTRYLSDGRLDPTFDGDGSAWFDVPGTSESASSLLLQPDGSIIVAGSVYSSLGRAVMLAMKVSSNGALDASFDEDGVLNVDASTKGSWAQAIARQVDGKLLLVGGAVIGDVFPGQGRDFAIARINTDGTLDRAFDSDGVNTVDFASHYLDDATGVAVLGDGRIAVSGYSTAGRYWMNNLRPESDSNLAVVMFTAVGGLDSSFDGDGKLVVDVSGKTDVFADLVLRDGQLTLAGTSLAAEHGDFSLVRLNMQPALALDLQAASDLGASPTDNVTKSTSLVFDVASADSPYYRVYRNGTLISASYQTGRSFTAANQTAGVQNYSIEYVDMAGNVSPKGRSLQVTIDTTAPAPPFFSSISDDTGTSNQDRITSDTTLKIHGSAEPSGNVRVSKTGVGLIGATAVDSAGKWMFDYSKVPLAMGSHSFTAVTEDLAGNTSVTSSVFQVIVQPEVTVDDPRVTERTGTSVTLSFTVRLSSPSSSTVSVSFATSGGTATPTSDFTNASGWVSLAPGATTKTVGVTIIGDALDELDETVLLNLTSATNAIITDAQGVGTIVDDDAPPTLSIGDARIVEGNSGATNVVLTVRLSAPSGLPVTVDYVTSAGTATAGVDFLTSSGTLSFAKGETVKTITLTILGDISKETDETFWVMLTRPTNAGFFDDTALVTIANDD